MQGISLQLFKDFEWGGLVGDWNRSHRRCSWQPRGIHKLRQWWSDVPNIIRHCVILRWTFWGRTIYLIYLNRLVCSVISTHTQWRTFIHYYFCRLETETATIVTGSCGILMGRQVVLDINIHAHHCPQSEIYGFVEHFACPIGFCA